MMFQKPHYAKPQNVSSHPLPPLQPFINLDDFHLAKPIFAAAANALRSLYHLCLLTAVEPHQPTQENTNKKGGLRPTF